MFGRKCKQMYFALFLLLVVFSVHWAQTGAWIPQRIDPNMSGYWFSGCGDNTAALTRQNSRYLYFFDLNSAKWTELDLGTPTTIRKMAVNGSVAIAFSDSVLIGYSGVVSKWDSVRFKGDPLEITASWGDPSWGCGDSLAYFVTSQYVYVFDALLGSWQKHPFNLPFNFVSGQGNLWSKGDYVAIIYGNENNDQFYNIAYSLPQHAFAELSNGGYRRYNNNPDAWTFDHGFILFYTDPSTGNINRYIGYSAINNQFEEIIIDNFHLTPDLSYNPALVELQTCYVLSYEESLGDHLARFHVYGFDTRHGFWKHFTWDYNDTIWSTSANWDIGGQFAVSSKINLQSNEIILFIYSGINNDLLIKQPGIHDFGGIIPGFGGTVFGKIDSTTLYIYSTRTTKEQFIPYDYFSEQLNSTIYFENFAINSFQPANNTDITHLIIFNEREDTVLSLTIPKEKISTNNFSPHLFMRNTYGKNNEVIFYSGLVHGYQLISFPASPNLNCKGVLACASGTNKFVVYDATLNRCDSLPLLYSINPETNLSENLLIIPLPWNKTAYAYSAFTHQLQQFSFEEGLEAGKCGNYVAVFWHHPSKKYYAFNGFSGDLVELSLPKDLNTINPVVGHRTILVANDTTAYAFDPQVSTGLNERHTPFIAKNFRLLSNYPNPFNAATTIRYELNQPARISLKIYNTTGQLIKTLENGVKQAGNYKVKWDGTNEHGQAVASGIYFYRLQVEKQTKMRKMILLR